MADSVTNEQVKLKAAFEHEQVMHAERNQRNLLLLAGAGVLAVAGGLWWRLRFTHRSRALIRKEKDVSEGLLLNILPAEVAAELKAKGHVDARHFDQDRAARRGDSGPDERGRICRRRGLPGRRR